MPKAKTIPAVEARVHLGKIIKQVLKEGRHFIVEKSGIPVVAIINAAEYARFITEREERFAILNHIKDKLPDMSQEEIEKDVNEAIRSVRKTND